MTATLRVILDQLVAPTDAALAEASRDLARALVIASPSGCEVEVVVPSGPSRDIEAEVPGVASIQRSGLPRRELAAALQLGIPTGISGGMVHSPTMFAPLVKHDRVHDHDQTVITVWDLRAWEHPGELPRAEAGWQRAMLKRAVKHADAVVVPTHSMGERLAAAAALGDRIRVIAGAAPTGFAVPTDEVGRRRELGLPEGYVLLAGGAAESDGLDDGFAAVARSQLQVPVVVIDAGDGEEPILADRAAAAGLPERLLHVRGTLQAHDRAAVFGAALALVAPSRRMAFPWRVLEGLALGVPVVAAGTDVHREVVVDGGALVEADASGSFADGLAAALAEALASTATAERFAVLASDRGRAFSWRGAADRVWQLHADL